MKILKERKTKLQSKNKLITAINLYEKYVDEHINVITIYASTSYLINDKWMIDIQNNKVSRCYPDIE